MQLLLFFVIYESSCTPLENIFLCMDEFKADAKWSEWMYEKFLINTLVNNIIFRYIYVSSTQKSSDIDYKLLFYITLHSVPFLCWFQFLNSISRT